MAGSLLDTSVLIVHLRGDADLLQRLRRSALATATIALSAITHYELYRGARASEMAGLDRLLSRFWTLPVSADVSREAARIWAELRTDSYTIDIADQFIAATARLYGLTVVTYNVRHFQWVRELTVVHPTAMDSGVQ